MLYDPKWDNPNRVLESITLNDLIAWLELQPATKKYYYSHNNKCMLCAFLLDHGAKYAYVTGSRWDNDPQPGSEGVPLPLHFDDIAAARDTFDKNRWTYGAALTRAKNIREALC